MVTIKEQIQTKTIFGPIEVKFKKYRGSRIRFKFESMVKVYYHCVVKVCELDQADECAFYKLNSNGGKCSYIITSYIIT